MTTRKSPESQVSDPTGFKAVVEAEEVAANRLESGRAEAELIRQNATVRERRIALRTDQRIQALHAAMKAKIAEDKAGTLKAFEKEQRDHSAGPKNSDIEAAALALGRKLVGLDPE